MNGIFEKCEEENTPVLYTIREGIFYTSKDKPGKYCAISSQEIKHKVFVLYYKK